mmetsp:Transcript_11167/g.26830  ORF Transcript_11167/g.26830 Transcript_11167/m.26830 type:complete len:87 (-) Transcript_11167:37-297(-)
MSKLRIQILTCAADSKMSLREASGSTNVRLRQMLQLFLISHDEINAGSPRHELVARFCARVALTSWAPVTRAWIHRSASHRALMPP